MINMNPCPLCKCSHSLVYTTEPVYNKLMVENGSAAVNIECTNCGLIIWSYSSRHKKPLYDNVRQSAIAKWNRLSVIEDDGK